MVKEVALEEDLSVGNRNYVSWDVSRYVAGLSLDDRQSGKRTTTLNVTLHALWQVVHLLGYLLLFVHLSGTLQKTRVQIEHVTGISLTS